MAESAGQVTVTVKEAAKIAGVSEKQVRAWVKEGTVRADLVRTRYGPTYAIEASSLPAGVGKPATVGGHGTGASTAGSGPVPARVEERVIALLQTMLETTQAKLEGAATRAAQLELSAASIPMLTANAESLQARAEAAEADRRQIAEALADERTRSAVLCWQRALLLAVVVVLLVAGVGVAWWQMAGR